MCVIFISLLVLVAYNWLWGDHAFWTMEGSFFFLGGGAKAQVGPRLPHC